MAQITTASNALLAEHFGWTPLSLVDDVLNAVNEIVYGGIESVNDCLVQLKPDVLGFSTTPATIRDTDDDGNELLSDAEEAELTQGVHQLETLLAGAVDKNFDAFELFVLRNLLVVHPDLVGWVRLEHHKGLDFTSAFPAPTTDQEGDSQMEHPLPIPAAQDQQHLKELRQTYLATKAFNLELQAEKASNDRILIQLRQLLASTDPATYSGEPTPFSHLANAKATRDAAAFTASQFGLIQNLVSDVKPKYDALLEAKDKAAAAVPTGPDAERQQYIEKMARRHLEINRNLRLNAHGEVVGGDFEDGVKKESEEVQKLEEIAGSIGKGTW